MAGGNEEPQRKHLISRMVGLALVWTGKVYPGGKPAEVKTANQKAIFISVGKSHSRALITDGSMKCRGATGRSCWGMEPGTTGAFP